MNETKNARLTYCNPLVLPDYPRGRSSIDKTPDTFGYLQDPPRDFRETADPSVLYHDGRWYLYPSCGMAYVSDDFVTWRHVRMDPYDCGYAPTVVAHRGRFLLTACKAPIMQSDNPLGPFVPIGPLRRPNGEPVENFNDPMLFSDDDGRLYAYWGLSAPGIFGAEIDPERPDRLLTEPRILFSYDASHEWERYGPNNEDASKSFVEGPWMVKVGSRYFLTYAAPGTEWRTYGMGTYVSDAPLGEFRYQARNPILRQTAGLIRGPGHGCIVKGPRDTLWAFYTCTVCYEHIFERRIGMDPAGIDADGNLFVRPASEIPQ
ncbi:MAG: family 43 glycosylhydrolase, partial [FCB group bacterium]|nr:family 43 glycosylhydrolase [FCB group bacterium]